MYVSCLELISVSSASSPVHQNKYSCFFHQMDELIWSWTPQGWGGGVQQGMGLWEQAHPFHSAAISVTAHHYWLSNTKGLPAWGIMDGFETKTMWSWAKNWGEKRSSLPLKHLFSDLLLYMFAEIGTGSGCCACGCFDSCPSSEEGKSLRHSALSSWPLPTCSMNLYRRGMSEVQWQEPPALGSLPLHFQCLF